MTRLFALLAAAALSCGRNTDDRQTTTPRAIDSTGVGEESGAIGPPGTTRGTLTGTSGTSGTGFEPDQQRKPPKGETPSTTTAPTPTPTPEPPAPTGR